MNSSEKSSTRLTSTEQSLVNLSSISRSFQCLEEICDGLGAFGLAECEDPVQRKKLEETMAAITAM